MITIAENLITGTLFMKKYLSCTNKLPRARQNLCPYMTKLYTQDEIIIYDGTVTYRYHAIFQLVVVDNNCCSQAYDKLLKDHFPEIEIQ
jgi:hypothetical protein